MKIEKYDYRLDVDLDSNEVDLALVSILTHDGQDKYEIGRAIIREKNQVKILMQVSESVIKFLTSFSVKDLLNDAWKKRDDSTNG